MGGRLCRLQSAGVTGGGAGGGAFVQSDLRLTPLRPTARRAPLHIGDAAAPRLVTWHVGAATAAASAHRARSPRVYSSRARLQRQDSCPTLAYSRAQTRSLARLSLTRRL